MFNTIQFLKDFNIPFETNGKNSSKGFINVCCYACEDSTFHLGIHENKGYGSCWRCGYKSLYNIIKHLTPFENTEQIIKQYDTNLVINNKINKKLNYNNTEIKLPGSKLEKCHKLYLQKRGFDPDYLEEKYKLQGTLIHREKYIDNGQTKFLDLSYRIIIPIFQNSKLVTYQTRGITKDTKYINCLPNKEIIPIKETLYGLDQCKENWILINEGCFKTFKFGDNSCSTYGKNFSNIQIKLLSKYKKIFIAFDPDQAGKDGALKLTEILDSLGIEVYNIQTDNYIDEMSNYEIEKLKENIYKYI